MLFQQGEDAPASRTWRTSSATRARRSWSTRAATRTSTSRSRAHEGLRIRYVLETHRQEDFVMGSGELAKKLGAKVVSLDHKLFGHSDLKLADGEELELAGVRIKALHTPGHTPESTCYAVYLEDSKVRLGGLHGRHALHRRDGPHRPARPREDRRERRLSSTTPCARSSRPSATRRSSGPRTPRARCAAATSPSATTPPWASSARTTRSSLEGRDAFIARKVRERIPRPPYFRTMEVWNLEGGRPLAKQASAIPVLAREGLRERDEAGPRDRHAGARGLRGRARAPARSTCG
jgi:hydroxyacylglutathione hydrolase